MGAPGPNSNMRGVPDVAYQASATTGVLVYISLPNDGNSGLICGGSPCSTGWYDIGGTSASSPQWAGLIAIADQMAGHNLGFINPALYQIANNPAQVCCGFLRCHDELQPDNFYPRLLRFAGLGCGDGLGHAECGEPLARPHRGGWTVISLRNHFSLTARVGPLPTRVFVLPISNSDYSCLTSKSEEKTYASNMTVEGLSSIPLRKVFEGGSDVR